MTSNAEDQNNLPAAVTLEPPKAAERANVVATKARCRVHEAQNKMCKAVRPAASGPNAKRLPNRPRPAAGCPRGQQGGQGLGPVEAARWRFTERGGLVGAFCPRMSERYRFPENGLKLVSAKSEGGGAPLLALTADRASVQVPANRDTIVGLMALRLTPMW
jgi:hypothetical protein